VNDTVSPANVWQRYRGLFPGDPRGYANEISSLKTRPAENGRRLLGVYEEWFTLEPENPAVRRSFAAECVNLGITYYHRDRPDSARAYFSKALLIDSTNARALNNLGSVYAEEGRPDLAISLFHKAAFYDSSFSDAYYNLGMSYGDAGEKEKGLIYLRKASELGNAAARKALQGVR
jgi:tetratricopeptide (TPR) repeat protein